MVQPIHLVDDGFDYGVHDFATEHADADVVADFVGFGGHG
jgi:hypothetical protein